MARTITSANSSLALNVPGVFPIPVLLEGYATDDAFDTENVAPAEAMMGVDAHLSAGYTPYPVKLKLVFQADSVSNDIFDQIRAAMDQAKEVFQMSATLIVPSIGKIFTFLNGYLTGDLPTPQGKKVLGPQTYELTFESLTAAPV